MTILELIDQTSRNRLLIWTLNEAIRTGNKPAVDLWFEKMGHIKQKREANK
jgi:hypothetical protein